MHRLKVKDAITLGGTAKCGAERRSHIHLKGCFLTLQRMVFR